MLVAVTTLSFDIAVLELQLPLTLGATVVIASRDESIDGRALRTLLDDVRRSSATDRGHLAAATQALEDKQLKALVGGEALRRDLADQLIALGVELWNMFARQNHRDRHLHPSVPNLQRDHLGGQLPTPSTSSMRRNDHCAIGIPGELHRRR